MAPRTTGYYLQYQSPAIPGWNRYYHRAIFNGSNPVHELSLGQLIQWLQSESWSLSGWTGNPPVLELSLYLVSYLNGSNPKSDLYRVPRWNRYSHRGFLSHWPTLIWFISVVCSQMAYKITILRGCFVTIATLIWFIPGVCPHMC